MALRLALDTNRYIDFCKGESVAVKLINGAREIFLPLVVVAELRAGFRCSSKSEHNEKVLSKFLKSDRVSLMYPDEATTHIYAQIFAQLREKGSPIPTNDLWIAALAVQYNLPLFSRDAHFDEISQLALI